MEEYKQRILQSLEAEISQAYTLLDLGQKSFVMIPLRKAMEALCVFLADTAGLLKEEREKKYLFGASLLNRDELREKHNHEFLQRLREINEKTRSYAHFQSEDKMEELNESFQMDLDFVLTEFTLIIKEYLDPDFEIKRLHHDSISKIGQQKGKEAFDEIIKLQFSTGLNKDFIKKRNKIIDACFDGPDHSANEEIQSLVRMSLEFIDYEGLIEESKHEREFLILMLNSGDENQIRRVGKIAKENSLNDLRFAAQYQLGRYYGEKMNDQNKLLDWMKICIQFSKHLTPEQFEELYNEIYIKAVIRAYQVYVDKSQWKRAERLLEGCMSRLDELGDLYSKSSYFHSLTATKLGLNLPKEALVYSQKHLNVERSLDNPAGEVQALTAQSAIAERMGNDSLAKSLLKDAKELASKNNLDDLLKGIGVAEGFWEGLGQ